MDAAALKLSDMLQQIEPLRFQDIAVELFQAQVDEFIFGLVDESPHSDHEWVNLTPADVVFYPPWDGRYDT
jgi:hypothetical protein